MPMIKKRWIPCLLRDDDRYAIQAKDSGDEVFKPGRELFLYYRIPLAPILNRRRLCCDGLRVGLKEADSGNFVNEITLIGVNFNGATQLWKNPSNLTNSQDSKMPISPAKDLSSYAVTDVRLTLTVTTPGNLRIAYVMARCYYQ